MSTAETGVVVAGLAAIAWVNWYFFVAGRAPAVAAGVDGSGLQRLRIEVHGGYTPDVVRVRAGQPVRLEFHRTETNTCTEEVVLPEFGIRKFLEPFATTPVEFTPAQPGSYEFMCGMGMVHGRIIADAD